MVTRENVDAYDVRRITVVQFFSMWVKSVMVNSEVIPISIIYDFILLVDEVHIVTVFLIKKDVSFGVVIFIVDQFRVGDTEIQIISNPKSANIKINCPVSLRF